MGESDRFQEYKRTRSRFNFLQQGNAVMTLFVLNTVFFLLLMTVQVAYYFYQQTPETFYVQVIQWFELPANFATWSERPWTILTYMFSDTGNNLFRLVSNMIWLSAFGYVLQEMAGNDKIIPIYIYGGVTGGIIFMLSNYLLPTLRPQLNHADILGANASVMAVAMATTSLDPQYKLFRNIRGGIPIWILMAIYILIDYAGVANASAAHRLAHLGGAAAGFFFVLLLRKGKDGSIWMNNFYDWFINLFNPYKSKKGRTTKERIFYNSGNRTPFKKTSNVTQQRIDDILDKINQKGYHFLTDEEKEILKKASEQDL